MWPFRKKKEEKKEFSFPHIKAIKYCSCETKEYTKCPYFVDMVHCVNCGKIYSIAYYIKNPVAEIAYRKWRQI